MTKPLLTGICSLLAATNGALMAAEVKPSVSAEKAKAGEANMGALRTVFSASVELPNVIVCNKLGRVRLIGIHSPAAASPGYQKALKATQKYAQRKSVKIEVCPTREKDLDGATRARVFFLEGGEWHGLNEKLLRAGLASAVRESPCHIDFASWGTLVAQARAAHRGLFSLGIEIPDETPALSTSGAAPTKSADTADPRPLGVLVRPSDPQSFARSLDDRGQPPLRVTGPLAMKYLGNSQTRTFHALGCLVQPWRAEQQVFFADREGAVRAGYRECVVCRPK